MEDSTHIIQVARRENGAKLDKILISPDLDFIPENTYIEAESAADQPGFSPLRVLSDPGASGEKYIFMRSGTVTKPPEDGIAVYTFEAEGNVNIWMMDNLFRKRGRQNPDVSDRIWSRDPARIF